jgi:tRNA(fMet)-specific endonuclease VapC
VGVLIDTGVLIELERGGAWAQVEAVAPGEAFGISVITVSELLHGVHRAGSQQRPGRQAFVEHLLAGIEALPITTAVARVHAGLGSELAAQGQPIGAHDLWIAATAIAHGHGVLTGNARDFSRVPGLRLLSL